MYLIEQNQYGNVNKDILICFDIFAIYEYTHKIYIVQYINVIGNVYISIRCD